MIWSDILYVLEIGIGGKYRTKYIDDFERYLQAVTLILYRLTDFNEKPCRYRLLLLFLIWSKEEDLTTESGRKTDYRTFEAPSYTEVMNSGASVLLHKHNDEIFFLAEVPLHSDLTTAVLCDWYLSLTSAMCRGEADYVCHYVKVSSLDSMAYVSDDTHTSFILIIDYWVLIMIRNWKPFIYKRTHRSCAITVEIFLQITKWQTPTRRTTRKRTEK